MRIEQLYFLIEAAKIGSINAASNKLHISQQSLNTTLKSLETELGVQLFKTNNRGIALTPQGELVIAAAEDILPRYAQLQKDLEESLQTQTASSGSIRVQTTPSMLESLLPGVFKNFYSRYPAINVAIKEQEHLQIVQSLVNNETDIGIFGLQTELLEQLVPQFKMPNYLEFVPLYQYKIVLAVGKNTALAKYKSISIKSALKYPFVLNLIGDLASNFTYLWLKLYGNPQIKLTTSSTSIYKNMITSGQAVGTYLAQRHCGVDISLDEDIVLVPIRDAGALSTVGYLYNTKNPISSALQAFIDELTTYCI